MEKKILIYLLAILTLASGIIWLAFDVPQLEPVTIILGSFAIILEASELKQVNNALAVIIALLGIVFFVFGLVRAFQSQDSMVVQDGSTTTASTVNQKAIIILSTIEAQENELIDAISTIQAVDQKENDSYAPTVTALAQQYKELESTRESLAALQPDLNTTITYLSDVPLHKISVAGNNYCVGRDPIGDPPTCTGSYIELDGILYSHSLFSHADSALVFDIEGIYDTFVASSFLFGSDCGDGAAFRVDLDGHELYTSPTIKHGDIPHNIRLDVKDGHFLRLETSMGSDGDNDCDGTVWGEPYLIK